MNPQPRQRSLALILALVPGWGHVYWGRERLGLALFTVAAVFGFALINGLFIYQGDGRTALQWTSGIFFAAVWAAGWIEILARTSPERLRREMETRKRLLDDGTVAYLQNDCQKAIDSFRACLRFEPNDVEAFFRLGVVYCSAGDRRQSRRWLRKTIRCDLEEKWRWEVEQHLERLNGGEGAERSQPKKTKEEEAERASA